MLVLVNFVFSFTLFRDINESNGLKLKLFYNQLALEIQIIKQLSRFHLLAVTIKKISCHMKYLDYDFQIEQWNNFFFTNFQHSKNIY